MTTILGLSGSLRGASLNSALLRAAVAEADSHFESLFGAGGCSA